MASARDEPGCAATGDGTDCGEVGKEPRHVTVEEQATQPTLVRLFGLVRRALLGPAVVLLAVKKLLVALSLALPALPAVVALAKQAQWAQEHPHLPHACNALELPSHPMHCAVSQHLQLPLWGGTLPLGHRTQS